MIQGGHVKENQKSLVIHGYVEKTNKKALENELFQRTPGLTGCSLTLFTGGAYRTEKPESQLV